MLPDSIEPRLIALWDTPTDDIADRVRVFALAAMPSTWSLAQCDAVLRNAHERMRGNEDLLFFAALQQALQVETAMVCTWESVDKWLFEPGKDQEDSDRPATSVDHSE